MYLGKRKVDLIGDIHGCYEELLSLLDLLGYSLTEGSYKHPEGRMIVFIGDLVSRGPYSLPTLDLAMNMVRDGNAVVIRGNNEDKFLKYLNGDSKKIRNRLLEEILEISSDKRDDAMKGYKEFIEEMPLYAFWGGNEDSPEYVFVHAAWKPEVESMSLADKEYYSMYGPMGTIPCKYGYCLVQDWVTPYPEGAPTCVMGHTPFSGLPYKDGNTICIDTAAVFGGHLSSFSLPEEVSNQVKSKEYWPAAKLLNKPHYDPNTNLK